MRLFKETEKGSAHLADNCEDDVASLTFGDNPREYLHVSDGP
jgi:hypothetical protein